MKRVSSYAIPIDVSDKEYMLLHGYSGAIDIIDKDTWDKLNTECLNQDNNDDELIDRLVQRGHITTMTHNEEVDYVMRLATALHKKDMLINSSYTLVVTYDCNFRCPYCFELNTMTDELRQSTMTRDMVDAIFTLLDKSQAKKTYKTKNITLFGGEPLLAKNYDIVSYIVNKGIDRDIRFTAITNGYDLMCFKDLLSPDKIRSIQMTIDGTEETHNKKRPHCMGYPTFQTIVTNIAMALEKEVDVIIRFNTDKTNISQLLALKEIFDKVGYTKNKKFHIHSARLRNHNETLTDNDLKSFMTQREFIRAHNQLNFEYGCQDFGTYNKIYNAICNGKPLPYKSTFCGSQSGMCVFDPLYKVYPCWDVVGNEEYVIGDYSSGEIVWNEKKRNKWIENDITKYKECRGCQCALFCGGGCMAHGQNGHCTQMHEIIKYAAQKAYTMFNSKK